MLAINLTGDRGCLYYESIEVHHVLYTVVALQLAQAMQYCRELTCRGALHAIDAIRDLNRES